MRALVAFSHELTHCIYRQPTENRSQVIDDLIEKYGSIAGINRKILQEVLDEAVTDTKETFTMVGVPLNDLHLRHQYQLALLLEIQPRAPGARHQGSPHRCSLPRRPCRRSRPHPKKTC